MAVTDPSKHIKEVIEEIAEVERRAKATPPGTMSQSVKETIKGEKLREIRDPKHFVHDLSDETIDKFLVQINEVSKLKQGPYITGDNSAYTWQKKPYFIRENKEKDGYILTFFYYRYNLTNDEAILECFEIYFKCIENQFGVNIQIQESSRKTYPSVEKLVECETSYEALKKDESLVRDLKLESGWDIVLFSELNDLNIKKVGTPTTLKLYLNNKRKEFLHRELTEADKKSKDDEDDDFSSITKLERLQYQPQQYEVEIERVQLMVARLQLMNKNNPSKEVQDLLSKAEIHLKNLIDEHQMTIRVLTGCNVLFPLSEEYASDLSMDLPFKLFGEDNVENGESEQKTLKEADLHFPSPVPPSGFPARSISESSAYENLSLASRTMLQFYSGINLIRQENAWNALMGQLQEKRSEYGEKPKLSEGF